MVCGMVLSNLSRQKEPMRIVYKRLINIRARAWATRLLIGVQYYIDIAPSALHVHMYTCLVVLFSVWPVCPSLAYPMFGAHDHPCTCMYNDRLTMVNVVWLTLDIDTGEGVLKE